MRITAGTLRGRVVDAPNGKGTRPTPSMVRQALFNRLGESVCQATVLDLFAGSGIISFEAISRGAKSATLIENERNAKQAILHSIDTLQLDTVTLMPGDVFKILPRLQGKQFDLIYADPPYNQGFGERVIEAISQFALLKEWGTFFLEEGKELLEVAPLQLIDIRRYGSTYLHCLQLQ